MARLTLAATVLALCIAARASSARAESIAEPHFGLAIALPEGLRHCEEGMHVGIGVGIAIALDRRDDDPCGGKNRVIRIIAGVVETARSEELQRRLRSDCVGSDKPGEPLARCSAAPGGLRIATIATEAIRLDYASGKRSVTIAGYGGAPGRTILYLAGLDTTRATYSDDLNVFRRVLGGISLSMPQP